MLTPDGGFSQAVVVRRGARGGGATDLGIDGTALVTLLGKEAAVAHIRIALVDLQAPAALVRRAIGYHIVVQRDLLNGIQP